MASIVMYGNEYFGQIDFTVPTDGVLTPSTAGTTGSDADWLNEIHPNASGWRKLAKVWHAKLKATLN